MWIDTRDMYAAGLTKGAVDRSALHAIMAGTMKLSHPFEVWRSKGPISADSEARADIEESKMYVFDSAECTNGHATQSFYVDIRSSFCLMPDPEPPRPGSARRRCRAGAILGT